MFILVIIFYFVCECDFVLILVFAEKWVLMTMIIINVYAIYANS